MPPCDVCDSVSYSDFHALARSVVEVGPPRALVEKVAAYIADAFLRLWPHVHCLTVAVMNRTGLLHFDEAQRATLARMRATFLVSGR